MKNMSGMKNSTRFFVISMVVSLVLMGTAMREVLMTVDHFLAGNGVQRYLKRKLPKS